MHVAAAQGNITTCLCGCTSNLLQYNTTCFIWTFGVHPVFFLPPKTRSVQIMKSQLQIQSKRTWLQKYRNLIFRNFILIKTRNYRKIIKDYIQLIFIRRCSPAQPSTDDGQTARPRPPPDVPSRATSPPPPFFFPFLAIGNTPLSSSFESKLFAICSIDIFDWKR